MFVSQVTCLEDFQSIHQAARRIPVPSCSRRPLDGAILPGVLRRVRIPCRYRGRGSVVGGDFDHEWPCATIAAAAAATVRFDVLVVGSRTSVGGVVAAECVLNASDKFTKSSAVVGGDGSIATITAVVAVAAEAAAGATNIALPPVELVVVVVVGVVIVVLILLFLLVEMMLVVVLLLLLLMVIIIRRFGHLQDRTGSSVTVSKGSRDSLRAFSLTFGCGHGVHRRSGIGVIILHSNVSSIPYSISIYPRRSGGLLPPPPRRFCSPR